ncbi:nucleotidyl transferase AbiEii/AbiGii toxin family protein [Candidatus Woesearchaeota archaeon]|nr:nucleotidyl transferase AbiEii/AbiGii toxin family protein [Candidatus Woesearchaeota archaeon]
MSKVIPQLFSDVPLFILIILDEKEIFAEKIRALVSRSEARDLYDVWILLNKKVEIDKKLILEKLKEENKRLSDLKLPSKEEYTNNLKQLVSFVPSYEQVKKEVLELIKKIK